MILLRLFSLDNHTDSIGMVRMMIFKILVASKSIVENNAISFLGQKSSPPQPLLQESSGEWLLSFAFRLDY